MSARSHDGAAARRAANRVRGSTKPGRALSAQRQTLHEGAYAPFLRAIRSNSYVSSRALPRPYPTGISQMHVSTLLADVSEPREFAWTSQLLTLEAPQLNNFVKLRDQFETALLSGSPEDCIRILDNVEATFGYSLWLVSRRIHVLQLARGLEAQKHYTEGLKSRSRPGSIAAYIAFYFSVRSEPTVTPSRLRAQLDTSLSSFGAPADLAAYIRYHVLGIVPPPPFIAETLRLEHTASIVDCYDTFVHLAASEHADPETTDRLAQDVAAIQHVIADRRLTTLAAFLNDDVPPAPAYRDGFRRAATALLLGTHDVAVASARSLLDECPGDPDLTILLARALSVSGQYSVGHTLAQRTAGQLARLMSGGPAAVDDYAEMVKLGLVLHSAPFGSALLTVIQDETSSTTPLLPYTYRQCGTYLSSTPNPFIIEMQPFGRSRDFTALGSYEQFLDSPVGDRGAALADATETPESFTALWTRPEVELVATLVHLSRNDSAAAISPAARLAGHTSPYFRRRGCRLFLKALLDSDRIDQAVLEITSTYIATPTWSGILPIEATSDALRSRATLPPTELSIPILFDMYAQHVDPSRDTERVFAYEDLLAGFTVDRPSQLAQAAPGLDRSKLTYFLRFICVESVMDRTLEFDSSRAVLDERLAVCRVLLTLDPSNSTTYHDEIKALAKRLRLSRRMRQLEQSKIYVDVENLRRKLTPELKEQYSRYTALRRDRPLIGELEIRDAVRLTGDGRYESVVLLRLPKNEVTDIFTTIVDRFRDEYTTSPEYGLDKYLSVRIRHGTLAAHLRRPVEAAHLVTPRDAVTNKYRANEYWPQRLPTPVSIDPAIAWRLAVFSEAFDSLVDEIKAWIHISTATDVQGLFDFALSDGSYTTLAHLVGGETPYEGFVDHLVQLFDQVLDRNLGDVRDRLETDAKRRASDLLEQLAMSIDQLGGPQCGELVHAIRTANNELQVAFDRIATWFRRASSSGAEPFSIAEAIDIGVESVKTINPQFEHSVKIDFDEELDLHGSLLTPFVDILFIILENVVKHSGDVTRPSARISATLRQGSLQVSVMNPVGPDIILEDVNERLDRLKAQIMDHRHSAFVRREGGSGFHKLARILQDDLRGTPHLGFGFQLDREFFVELSIPLKVIAYDHSASRGRREQTHTGDGTSG
jgi:hypothetical protein